MADRPVILVLSHDLSLAAAKTTRFLVQAWHRLGCTAIQRDTRIIRWTIDELRRRGDLKQLNAYQLAVDVKWMKLVSDYNVNTVMSLDLHWLISPNLFFKNESVRQMDALWFDDLRSHLQVAPYFESPSEGALDLMNHAKVRHFAYGSGQREELAELGVRQVHASALAAPAHYLRERSSPVVRDRLAFIGNPGLSTVPSKEALGLMQQGAEWTVLREQARREVLQESRELPPVWMRGESHLRIVELVAHATLLRLQQPFRAAVSLLKQAGLEFPETFLRLNQSGGILDAALLVKLVNRYDRPALVFRLWQQGLIDVIGTPEEWRLYGIKAEPSLPFPELPDRYRRYVAHVNASNCARDAQANEKLFEIAACGRVSINLDAPDIRACYENGKEVCLVSTLAEAEETARKLLRNPDATLALGQQAQERTAREHLWQHRLKKMSSQ